MEEGSQGQLALGVFIAMCCVLTLAPTLYQPLANNRDCFQPRHPAFSHCCEHGVEAKPLLLLTIPALVFGLVDALTRKDGAMSKIGFYFTFISVTAGFIQTVQIAHYVVRMSMDSSWDSFQAFSLLISQSGAAPAMVTLLFTAQEIGKLDRTDVAVFFQNILLLQALTVVGVGLSIMSVYFGAFFAFAILILPLTLLIPQDVRAAYNRGMRTQVMDDMHANEHIETQDNTTDAWAVGDVTVQVAPAASGTPNIAQVDLDATDNEPAGGVIETVLKRPIAMRILIFVTARFIFLAVFTLLPSMGIQLYAGMSWTGIIRQTFSERANAWPYIDCAQSANANIIDIIGLLW
jgi:hypothetical protein